MFTSASAVEVGVPLVSLGAIAAVAGAVGGGDAVTVRTPARVVRHVSLGGAAVAGVPDAPVEHDGHVEVVGPVEEHAVAVTKPLGLD